MERYYIATAMAIRDLNCWSFETQHDRTMLQKKIYLAQCLGLPLGYGFVWSIFAPYSEDLAEAAYKIIPQGDFSIKDRKFKKEFSNIIRKVNFIEELYEKADIKLGKPQFYDLLVMVHYFQTHCFKGQELSDKIIAKLPSLNEYQVTAALATVCSLVHCPLNSCKKELCDLWKWVSKIG